MKPRHPIQGLEYHDARIRELDRAFTRAVALILTTSLLLIAGLTAFACSHFSR